jgi:RHS repeat-associated protein
VGILKRVVGLLLLAGCVVLAASAIAAAGQSNSRARNTSAAEVRRARARLMEGQVGSQYATAPIGPGKVTLGNGNFALENVDVSIGAIAGDLSVGRTYNSQLPSASTLGPGWAFGTPLLSAGISYTKLVEQANGTVIATELRGTFMPFQPDGAGGYLPQTTGDKEFKRELKLTKVDPQTFTIDDDAGNQARFDRNGTSAEFRLTAVAQGGQGAKTVWEYETVNSVERVKRAIGPVPDGLASDCRTDPVPAGCRVLKFEYGTTTTASGTAESQWGDYEGQLKRIQFIAASPSNGQVTTTDVSRYDYDNLRRLRAQWDPRISPALKQRYDYTVTLNGINVVSDYTPPGERPWHLTYTAYTIDTPRLRLLSASRDALPSGTATWSVIYDVPLSGAGAPYNLSAGETAKWAQNAQPTTGVAIFPPTQVPSSSPPSSYSNATIHYLDSEANEVNTARPGGQITTKEYDYFRNVVRELTAVNRERALAQPSISAAIAAALDTRRSYNAEGTRLLDQFGPERPMWVSGATVTGRTHTSYTYNVGVPSTGGPYNVASSKTVQARVGSADSDGRTVSYDYSGQSNLGWKLRQPTSVTVDPGGLNLTTRTTFDPYTGTIAQMRMPSDSGGTTAGTRSATLYTVAANSTTPGCGLKPGVAGLPCIDKVAAQPTGSSQPAIPDTAHSYNRLFKEDLRIDASGSTARYTGTNYDAAGRLTSHGVSSNSGTALPDVTVAYASATGRETARSTSSGTITRDFDALGRLGKYTDVTGTETTTTYDSTDRLTSVADAKGTHGVAQFDLNNNPLSITDSQLSGSITATYDADSRLVTQTFPNGIMATYAYDPAGNTTALTYVKVTNCSSNCTWLSFTAVYNAHDQIVRYTGSGPAGDQGYTYDRSGRLTVAVDVQGLQCTIRVYGYDANGNRVTERTVPPLGGGVCDFAGTGTTVSRTYDQADRVIGTGITYDPLGNITALPASAAGGAALTGAFFADNRVQSLTQSGATYSYTLDPARRVLARGATGSKTMHYGDDTDNPVWTGENVGESQYTRNIAGPDGNLVAIYDSQAGGVSFQLNDLTGGIAATAGPSSNIPGLSTTYAANEFGSPRSSSPRYGWLGAKERTSEFVTGTILMGQRVYIPQLGRFLQTDPVVGGSANPYDYVNQDPLNDTDLNGQFPLKKLLKQIAHSPFARDVEKVLKGVKAVTEKVAETVKRVLNSPAARRVSKGFLGCYVIRAARDTDNRVVDDVSDLYKCSGLEDFVSAVQDGN